MRALRHLLAENNGPGWFLNRRGGKWISGRNTIVVVAPSVQEIAARSAVTKVRRSDRCSRKRAVSGTGQHGDAPIMGTELLWPGGHLSPWKIVIVLVNILEGSDAELTQIIETPGPLGALACATKQWSNGQRHQCKRGYEPDEF